MPAPTHVAPVAHSLSSLNDTRGFTDEIRRQRKAMQHALTEISIYTNNFDQSAGLVYRGRIDVMDCIKYEWPMKKNVSSSGYFTTRAAHPIAKLIASIPNTPTECANIVVRVDRYGGKWRWTGLLHHWKVETRDGTDVLTASFNDDMQFLQFMLVRPNPLGSILFQWPRDWFVYGPAVWGIAVTGLLELFYEEGNLGTLPDDPFDITQWIDPPLLDWEKWQVHIKCNPFTDLLTDASLWTLIAGRMNTYESVIADPLDDGQLCMTYRRYFTGEGEPSPTGLLVNNVANGALVFEVSDRSGFTLPGGTFFNGNVITGMVRSVLQWSDGYIEDTLNEVVDDESLYADEYWQSGWMTTLVSAPTVGIKDSWWNDLQSTVTYAPATASKVVVGGDNPTADAIVKLLIESIGNLIGYFLLAGFDTAGDIAADIIMPFLVGTILAWDEWKNTGRTTSLGWCHLFTIFQQGAENNSWSLSADAALRGGFTDTEAQTSHTMVIGEDTWLIPGLHCQIGDRFWSTSGALQRAAGIDIMFVNQIEEQNLTGDDSGASHFIQKCGQNKAVMTTGERAAKQLKFALDKLQDIGVHLIS